METGHPGLGADTLQVVKLDRGSADDGTMGPSPRPFLVASGVSIGCLLSAFVVPSDSIASVLAIGAVLVGLPLCVVLYVDFVRSLGTDPEKKPRGVAAVALGAPVFLLGAASLGAGAAIVLWVLYNTLIERDPAYTGPASFAGFGIGPLLILFGWRLVRSPFEV